MKNLTDNLLDSEGHLTDEGKVIYVKKMQEDSVEELPSEVVHHIQSCLLCRTDLLDWASVSTKLKKAQENPLRVVRDSDIGSTEKVSTTQRKTVVPEAVTKKPSRTRYVVAASLIAALSAFGLMNLMGPANDNPTSVVQTIDQEKTKSSESETGIVKRSEKMDDIVVEESEPVVKEVIPPVEKKEVVVLEEKASKEKTEVKEKKIENKKSEKIAAKPVVTQTKKEIVSVQPESIQKNTPERNRSLPVKKEVPIVIEEKEVVPDRFKERDLPIVPVVPTNPVIVERTEKIVETSLQKTNEKIAEELPKTKSSKEVIAEKEREVVKTVEPETVAPKAPKETVVVVPKTTPKSTKKETKKPKVVEIAEAEVKPEQRDPQIDNNKPTTNSTPPKEIVAEKVEEAPDAIDKALVKEAFGNKDLKKLFAANFDLPELYATTIRSNNSDVSNQLTAAEEAYEEGKYEAALTHFKAAHILEQDNINIVYYLGICQLSSAKNQSKAALASFDKVIEHQDNHFIQQAEWYKALTYLKMGNEQAAKKQLERIVELEGSFADRAKKVFEKF